MGNDEPQFIENREFVELEEEDIHKLNKIEGQKFDRNPQNMLIMYSIEQELGDAGRWEEHWLTVDPSGRRVYARIYYTEERALALTADGRIVREITYPKDDRLLH